MKNRVLTGTRPSGRPHLGNYYGAYKPAVELQKKYGELYFFLADLHTLNGDTSPEQLRSQTLDLTATMLAIGLDPNKGCFFSQSLVPEVTELSWILGCQAPFGLLSRAHSFKDAQARGKEVNCGVFGYPILMAADILLYKSKYIPVGKDQKQHVEMTRDIVDRFHNRYGEVFVMPEPIISDAVSVIPGLDGEKMSKSKGNVIPIFASEKEYKKTVGRIVTDSKGVDEPKDPESCHVYKLFKIVKNGDASVLEMAEKYRAGGYGYGHAKQELTASLVETFSPMSEKYEALRKKEADLIDVLKTGAAKARRVAKETLEEVHKIVGTVA